MDPKNQDPIVGTSCENAAQEVPSPPFIHKRRRGAYSPAKQRLIAKRKRKANEKEEPKKTPPLHELGFRVGIRLRMNNVEFEIVGVHRRTLSVAVVEEGQ